MVAPVAKAERERRRAEEAERARARTRKKLVVRGAVAAAALTVLGFALRSIFTKPTPAVDPALTSASSAPDLDPVTKLRNGLL